MADLQDRFEHLEGREGLIAVGHLPMREARTALKRSLPTMDHAIALFDGLCAHLADRCWVDPEGGEHRRRLLRVDPEHPDWLVPHPLVEHAFASGTATSTVATFVNPDPLVDIDAPKGWKPGDPDYAPTDREPDIVPSGPDMRGGVIELHDGRSHFELRYDDRGLQSETVESSSDAFTWGRYPGRKPYTIDSLARPPSPGPIGLLCREDLDPAGHPVTDLVRMVAEHGHVDRIAARVRLPLPIPGGADGAWGRGLWALREALWDGRIAALSSGEAGWAVVDGFDGTAVAWGATLGGAAERWAAEVERVRPRLPQGARPAEPREADDDGPRVVQGDEGRVTGFSTGLITVRGPAGGDLAWPIPIPRHTPAVAVPIVPLPQAIPAPFAAVGFERWVRLLGQRGHIAHALVRDDPAGFTLVGEGVLDVVDPEALDEQLDASEAAERAFMDEAAAAGLPNPWADSEYRWRVLRYRVWDDGRRRAIPCKQDGGSFGRELMVRNLDGDQLRWRVARIRQL